MNKEKELTEVYNKLGETQRELETLEDVIRLMIFAGFITQEKVDEARSLVDDI